MQRQTETDGGPPCVPGLAELQFSPSAGRTRPRKAQTRPFAEARNAFPAVIAMPGGTETVQGGRLRAGKLFTQDGSARFIEIIRVACDQLEQLRVQTYLEVNLAIHNARVESELNPAMPAFDLRSLQRLMEAVADGESEVARLQRTLGMDVLAITRPLLEGYRTIIHKKVTLSKHLRNELIQICSRSAPAELLAFTAR